MARDVFSLVADHYVSQKATTPGRSALAAVRAILASGQAHIVSLTAPAAPPATGEEASSVNNLLGWTATPDGGSRPGGSSIGWIAYPKGEGVVFLNAIPAFNEAQDEQRWTPADHGPGHRRPRRGGEQNLVGGGCSHPAEAHRRRRCGGGARRRERPGRGVSRLAGRGKGLS